LRARRSSPTNISLLAWSRPALLIGVLRAGARAAEENTRRRPGLR
jgi:hypothetical protein